MKKVKNFLSYKKTKNALTLLSVFSPVVILITVLVYNSLTSGVCDLVILGF